MRDCMLKDFEAISQPEDGIGGVDVTSGNWDVYIITLGCRRLAGRGISHAIFGEIVRHRLDIGSASRSRKEKIRWNGANTILLIPRGQKPA